MTEVVHCPWCGLGIRVEEADLVPEFPKGFKWNHAPCCKAPFVITRHEGRLHVQRYTEVTLPPPPALPS